MGIFELRGVGAMVLGPGEDLCETACRFCLPKGYSGARLYCLPPRATRRGFRSVLGARGGGKAGFGLKLGSLV